MEPEGVVSAECRMAKLNLSIPAPCTMQGPTPNANFVACTIQDPTPDGLPRNRMQRREIMIYTWEQLAILCQADSPLLIVARQLRAYTQGYSLNTHHRFRP